MASALPHNQAAFTLAEIAAATSARARAPAELRVQGVITDNRGPVAGKLFVALRGPRFDGHRFVRAALDAGAALALVDEQWAEAESDPRLVIVADCYRALGQLARLHRQRWRGQVVAIAGSAGKTTTRRAIAVLLEQLFAGQVHSPPGNLNNQVGVPLVLLGLEPRHRYAVVEVGTNHPGEVAWLASLVQPDVAVLTLIGIEHSEGLGTLEQIATEEGALFGGLGSAGSAVLNADDALVLEQAAAHGVKHVVRVGRAAGARYRVLKRKTTPEFSSMLELERDGQVLRFEVALLGAAGEMAAAFAAAVAETVRGRGVTEHELGQALRQFRAEPGRLTPHLLADASLLLDDSYNANPPSVRAGLEVACELAAERRTGLVVILGEMRELGASSAPEHAAIGTLLGRSAARHLIAIGEQTRPLLSAAADAGLVGEYCATAQEAMPVAERLIRAGDVVWVKASRGIGAERLVERLVTGRGEAE